MTHDRRALETAGYAGRILLENGAEIGRVQETMIRILQAFQVTEYNVYVISNGIFATVNERREDALSLVRHVPLGSVNLSRIDAVNEVSREICDGRLDMDGAEQRLKEAEQLLPESPLVQVLASGLGAAGFCYLFGGTLAESVAAFPIGLLLWIYILKSEKRHSGFIQSIVGSLAVTLLSGLADLIPGVGFQAVVIGGIIPLVPGVTFSTSVREFFNGDYLSGLIHMVAAILTAVCIALGVCGGVALLQWMGGAVA